MRKHIFHVAPAPKTTDFALLLLRLGFSLMMLTHGWPKLQKLLAGSTEFASVLGMSPAVSLGLAVFAEVGCSVLLILGLLTRFATIPLIITMLVAVLVMHGADPFGDKEMGLHYLVVYLVLLFAGPGRYSLDALLHRRR
jgi:putative oxidoreductase